MVYKIIYYVSTGLIVGDGKLYFLYGDKEMLITEFYRATIK